LTAYDDTVQAECGLPALQQMLTGEASYVGTLIADKVAGLTALYATMMALFHRERTGEGQEVEVSMFETMASFILVEHANGAMFDPPLGPAVYPRAVAPNRRPYRTKDGQISALIYNDKQWSAFVEAVHPPWAGEGFATLEQRVRRIDTVYALLADTLKERTTQNGWSCSARSTYPRRRFAHPMSCSTIRICTRSACSRPWIRRMAACAFQACPPGFRAPQVASPAPPRSSAPIRERCSRNSDCLMRAQHPRAAPQRTA
jgi:crotonobetainyl-CoA:carnitine CoA-transferase CaiB-like acyl-CoA transferase